MVGSSIGVKSPDIFGTFSSSPACGSTLKESIPLNPLHPKSSLELSVSTTANGADGSSLISKAVYVRYKDHVFFRNIETPTAQAIIRNRRRRTPNQKQTHNHQSLRRQRETTQKDRSRSRSRNSRSKEASRQLDV